jgi:hypothetical protein
MMSVRYREAQLLSSASHRVATRQRAFNVSAIHFRFEVVWCDFHRLLAKRFPYAVYYKVDGDTCIVFRVLE